MLEVGFAPPEPRTSTLEDFIEGFRRRVDVPGARRRDDDGDEEVAHGIRGRRPGGTTASPRVSAREKDIYWAGPEKTTRKWQEMKMLEGRLLSVKLRLAEGVAR